MAEHGLLFDAVLYLGAAVVFVPIARKLGLGSVLGYLCAGCVIGPFGFHFVRDVQSILHFAELGVVLMLFVIGLELDPKRLWTMRRDVFQGGAMQLFACGAGLTGLALALGIPWRGAMVSGLALALSSTAIAVQTMKERNLMNTPLGHTTFAILLFQDIAAIPLIGLVPLLSQGAEHSTESGWVGAAKVLSAIVIVVFIGRFLTRPALRVVAKTDLRELFTAFALLLVVGIALLMSLAGVSMALGAFLAGVLLASSEYRHALENDIEPFRGLLMGLFFIAVGMSIDFGLFARQPGLVLLVIGAFLAVKAVALAVLSKSLSVSPAQRWLFAALIGQGGEFAFVVFGVAREARLLPGEWDGIFTLAVALSMAATPIMLLGYDYVSARRESQRAKTYDEITDHDAPVIIAGFGRFGQIVGRLLFAARIKVTVLDHDPDQVEFLRRFGFRVFYGDATRLDLLQAAGAGTARLLINAIDDVDASVQLTDLVREHFPKLHMVARARNVTHYFELRARGVEVVERETFESALHAARGALVKLGIAPYEAREQADRFRQHNVRTLEAMLPNYRDETSRLSVAHAGRVELEDQFERDRVEMDRIGAAVGWHEDLDSASKERS
ncbi:MAG TPA: glutathione-regulated potassium-efflux system protein KefC [Polyangiales bacterium]|jgi:glutathione-regulated potassium-efflux system ancillary protein KefC|nr:glutathione-regulated potassium-efflux system protein KefC [Polyangiales bacterium]